MSWWTDIFISTSNLEDTGSEDAPTWPAIDFINSELSPFSLYPAPNPNPERHAVDCVWLGTTKAHGKDAIVEIVSEAPWEWRDQVQIFLRDEDDRGFQEFKLK